MGAELTVGHVASAHAVSADGYLAGPDDGPRQPLGAGGGRLCEWYSDGEVASRVFPSFRLSAASAAFFDRFASAIGAVLTGRRTDDIARGRGGGGPHPSAPVFVLSHRPPPAAHRPPPESAGPTQTFVDGGIEAAIELARAAADGRDVALQGSAAVRQGLAAGLLDVLVLHVVPVLLGGGVRLVDGVTSDLRLAEVVKAPGVTHLVYEIVRPG